mmetsp:Transcript_1712/g.5963  ORF Transcript_1712/g.5963 Transcript_1712/m.5963 type:complete len:270 (+) Transcript_1712:2071-2880(+)
MQRNARRTQSRRPSEKLRLRPVAQQRRCRFQCRSLKQSPHLKQKHLQQHASQLRRCRFRCCFASPAVDAGPVQPCGSTRRSQTNQQPSHPARLRRLQIQRPLLLLVVQDRRCRTSPTLLNAPQQHYHASAPKATKLWVRVLIRRCQTDQQQRLQQSLRPLLKQRPLLLHSELLRKCRMRQNQHQNRTAKHSLESQHQRSTFQLPPFGQLQRCHFQQCSPRPTVVKLSSSPDFWFLQNVAAAGLLKNHYAHQKQMLPLQSAAQMHKYQTE